MNGIALLLSTIVCFNSTICPTSVAPQINLKVLDSEIARINERIKTEEANKFRVLAEKLKDRKLQVTTLNDFPLSYSTKENEKYLLNGAAGKVLNILMDAYGFNYELVLPENNIVGGSNDLKGSVMEMLIEKKIDMAVTFMPYMADLYSVIEFSYPLHDSDWRMIMKRPSVSAKGAGLLAPFTHKIWYIILFIFFLFCPSTYIILRAYCSFSWNDKQQKKFSFEQIVWFTYGALMRQGGVIEPSSHSLRILFSTWWIYITLVTAFYTANLTVFIMYSVFTLPINVPRNLTNSRQKFVSQRGSAVEYAIRNPDEELVFLLPMINEGKGIFTHVTNDSHILSGRVANGYVYIRDKPAIDHMIYNSWKSLKTEKNDRKQCPFVLTTQTSLRRMRGFAYSNGFEWRELLNRKLIQIVEAGLVKHYLTDGLPMTTICPQNLYSSGRKLSMDDLETTFFLWISGICASIGILILEIALKVRQNSKKNHKFFSHRSKLIKVRPRKITDDRNVVQKSSRTPPPKYDDAMKIYSKLFEQSDYFKSRRKRFSGKMYSCRNTLNSNLMFKVLSKKKIQ